MSLVQRLHLVVQRLDAASHRTRATSAPWSIGLVRSSPPALRPATTSAWLARAVTRITGMKAARPGLQPDDFQPVDLGHHDVEQDQVGQRSAVLASASSPSLAVTTS